MRPQFGRAKREHENCSAMGACLYASFGSQVWIWKGLVQRMELTTLCYIEQEDKYLMLHRVKKENDINKDKWIGIGGHFEQGESPEECLLREAKEETGLTLTKFQFRGIITFSCDQQFTEYMHLYTATEWEGEIISCDEGELEWIGKDQLLSMNLWEGDYIFLNLLEERKAFFSLKLMYEKDVLKEAVLDGKPMDFKQELMRIKEKMYAKKL